MINKYTNNMDVLLLYIRYEGFLEGSLPFIEISEV